jgi:DNA-binding NtrC family response regulator
LQVRELETLLWDAIAESTGERITRPAAWSRKAAPPSAHTTAPDEPKTPELDRAQIEAAIERHQGVLEKVWRELGLRNRYVLRRLMAKHGIGAKDA